MPCATCNGTDHSRSSSTKCQKYKPPIRKRHLDTTKEYETYAIKMGLNRFFNPQLDEDIKMKLKNKIFDDCKVVSRLMIETSTFLKYYHDNMPSKSFPKLNVEQFTYVLKGSKYKIDDPLDFISKYKKEVRMNAPLYTCTHRSHLILEACKQYATNFSTNITTHMFKRIKDFVKLSNIEADYNIIHRECYEFYYNNSSNTNAITNILEQYNLRSKLVEKSPSLYLHFLFKLQALQQEHEAKICTVVPIYKQTVKHVTYTTMGLYELLASINEKTTDQTTFRDNALMYWRRYFNISKNELFGCCFSTNGVSVSKSMSRVKKNSLPDNTPDIKKHKTNYRHVIAVDPGAKLPIVTCNDKLEYQMLSANKVKFERGDYRRKDKLRHWTGRLEQQVLTELNNTDTTISFKSDKYIDMAKFKLNHFNAIQTQRERRNVIRLDFDKYISKQQVNHKIIREYFVSKLPEEGKNLILYGNGSTFMNKAHFKGHQKFFHNDILKYMKHYYNDKMDVLLVDEYNTTKTCSRCKQTTNFFVVSKNKHRYSYCKTCHICMNRDKNAARNILQKHWHGRLTSTTQ